MSAPTAAALAPDLEAALRRLKLAAIRRLAAEVLLTAKVQSTDRGGQEDVPFAVGT